MKLRNAPAKPSDIDPHVNRGLRCWRAWHVQAAPAGSSIKPGVEAQPEPQATRAADFSSPQSRRQVIALSTVARWRGLGVLTLSLLGFRASTLYPGLYAATRVRGLNKTVLAVCQCFLCVLLLCCAAQAQTKVETHDHEYAELQAAELGIKDLTFKTLDGKPLSLRELAAGNKLVLIHYFAAWCHNSNYDVETIKELYAKYKDQGFQVMAICEYSKPNELRDFINKYQPSYPIVLESERTKDREKTTHYDYRTSLQDKRLWGTPFNLLLNTADFQAMGDVVTNRAQAAFGELMKSEVEQYIRQQLKLP